MKRILNYKNFILESDNKEINIKIDDLIEILEDNEINLHTTLKLDDDLVKLDDDINTLYNNSEFNKFLKRNNLKKSKLQDSNYLETLLNDNIILKFFFIHKKGTIEIEEPKYIILQYYNKKKSENSNIRIFKNKNSINKFYELLTDKTIIIDKGKKEYVYKTSNSGNNWELKNPDNINKKFKKSIDKEELDSILKGKNTDYDVK